MKTSLILSLIALITAVAALIMPKVETSGSMDDYDFSSPASAIRSYQELFRSVATSEKAIELNQMMTSDGKDFYYIAYQEPDEFEVVKTIEIKNSGDPEYNGILVAFIKQTRDDGVEVYLTLSFKKDYKGRLIPSYYGYVRNESEEDKKAKAMIDAWKDQ
jgi:hypothetical protein